MTPQHFTPAATLPASIRSSQAVAQFILPHAVPATSGPRPARAGFLRSLLSGLRSALAIQIVTGRDIEDLARERYQAKVREALSEYVRTMTLTYEKKVELRHNQRAVLCGTCGASNSSIDVCPICKGYAEPILHPPMTERLKRAQVVARWSYRRAAARRRKEVMRPMRKT